MRKISDADVIDALVNKIGLIPEDKRWGALSRIIRAAETNDLAGSILAEFVLYALVGMQEEIEKRLGLDPGGLGGFADRCMPSALRGVQSHIQYAKSRAA